MAVWAQVAFGLLLLLGHLNAVRENWFRYGGGRPGFSLYGMRNVEAMTYDAKPRTLSVAASDVKLWRRLIFDRPDSINRGVHGRVAPDIPLSDRPEGENDQLDIARQYEMESDAQFRAQIKKHDDARRTGG